MKTSGFYFVSLLLGVGLVDLAAAACNRDGCLRALYPSNNVPASSSATAFCRTFTAKVFSTVPPSVPTPAAASCHNSPQSLSSACSCAVPAVTTTQASTTRASTTSAAPVSPTIVYNLGGFYRKFSYKGCYPVSKVQLGTLSTDSQLTVDKCFNLASSSSGSFAIGEGTHCYLGGTSANAADAVSDSFCNRPCPGNPSEVCYGNGYDIYYEFTGGFGA